MYLIIFGLVSYDYSIILNFLLNFSLIATNRLAYLNYRNTNYAISITKPKINIQKFEPLNLILPASALTTMHLLKRPLMSWL